MTIAIVFVHTEHLLTDGSIGVDHCAARGYKMGGVVTDDWATAMSYLLTGLAQVLVIADERHLDPNRVPRIEVAAHTASRRGGVPRERTRLIPRGGAA